MNLKPEVFEPVSTQMRNPWRIRPGLMLNGAGQCVESIHAMQKMQGEAQKPALIALYESLSGGLYHQNPDILEAHALFPGAVLQIGLQLPLFSQKGLFALAGGQWDGAIGRMADEYRKISLPILLRIGYEFDGEWNGYEPAAYGKAYRAIAGALAAAGADNVALVWDSCAADSETVMDWFPGGGVVDWYGYNTLAPKFSGPNRMAGLARAAGKPLMNGEASYAQGVYGMPFADWARGYFASMRAAGVRAFQYINWRWRVYPSEADWRQWADGRITDDPAKAAAYVNAMQGDDMVYRDGLYAQPLRLTVDCGRALGEGEPDAPWSPRHDHATGEEGFAYTVRGAVSTYGNGWVTAWRLDGEGSLLLTVPGAFEGECLIRPAAQEALALVVNSLSARWIPGCGYLHIPVRGQNALEINISREDGRPFWLSHVLLLRAESRAAIRPVRAGRDIRWSAAEGALYYHIYRDYMLWDIAAGCRYGANAPGVWHIAAYDAHNGLSAMEEVK